MRFPLYTALALGLTGPALAQDNATAAAFATLTELCPTAMANPEGILAQFALGTSPYEGAGGRTEDGRHIWLSFVTEDQAFFVTVRQSESAGGLQSHCTITLVDRDAEIDFEGLILSIDLKVAELLQSDSVIKTGGRLQSTDSDSEGDERLVQWATPDFPLGGTLSVAGERGFVTLTLGQAQRVE